MEGLKYKVIANLDQYNEYCNIYENLVLENDKKLEDEIELLELLIEDYNEKLMREYEVDLNPVELLSSIIEEEGISQAAFAKRFQISPQLLNDILKYRRDISKKFAFKLSTEFAMKIDAFIRPYNLKKAS